MEIAGGATELPACEGRRRGRCPPLYGATNLWSATVPIVTQTTQQQRA